MNDVPIGMKCTDCGCCLATIKAGDDWLCWECDAGETCKGKRSPQPPPQYRAVPDRLAPPIKLPPVTIEPKEKPVTVHNGKGSRHRIPEEIKQAIIAADPSISNCELARRYKISDPTVCTIRKKAGIVLTKGGHRTAKSKSKPAKAAKLPKRVTAPARVPDSEPVSFSLRFDVDERGLGRFWESFTAEDKLVAVRAVFVARLEA